MPEPNISVSDQLSARALPNRINYPNKVFSLAEHYLPTNPKELFRFTEYYYRTHPPLHQAIEKAARYPITDLNFETEDQTLRDAYHDLFYKTWKIRNLLTEIGIYRRVFGNCFVSVNVKPVRYLRCPDCNHYTRADSAVRLKRFRWRDFQFYGTCVKCGHAEKPFRVMDARPRGPDFLGLVIWNPNNIDIEYNEITGEKSYFYCIPNSLKKKILAGDPDVICDTPMMFIQAVKEGRKVRINPRNIFHFTRPGLSASDGGWGMPAPISALQDLFHRGIMRRAQEALASEHIVPLRFLFPLSNSDQPPALQMDLGEFKNQVESAVSSWKTDPNHVAIVPIPLGANDFSGRGRSLMVTQEIAQLDQSAVVGAGFPIEFVWGGLSFSGSSVSLRMLENDFINERADIEDFFDFVIGVIAPFLKWSPVDVRLSEFKMADDAMRRDMLLKLRMLNDVSSDTLLGEMGLDAEVEAKKMKTELRENFQLRLMQSRFQARAQGEAAAEMAMVEQRINQRLMAADPTMAAAGAPMQPDEQGEMGLQEMAWMHANEIGGLEDNQRQQVMSQMQAEMPEYHTLVNSILNETQDPIPTQRPPRRQNSPI